MVSFNDDTKSKELAEGLQKLLAPAQLNVLFYGINLALEHLDQGNKEQVEACLGNMSRYIMYVIRHIYGDVKYPPEWNQEAFNLCLGVLNLASAQMDKEMREEKENGDMAK